MGASVEYGNVQGAVVNVITKSGSNRFQYDAAYYWQTAALTSQPVRRVYDPARQLDSGYERAGYRDFTTSLGGPIVRDRLWFFSGYQHLRDSDSQPGTNPDLPREYEQDKIFAKLTWRLAPGWQLVQSFHDEFWSNPETPSATKPRDATQRLDASVPAINFGHLDSHGLAQYGLGRPRGTVPLHAGHVADLGRSDDPQSHRPARKHLERRPPANRPGAAGAHDGQGHPQPLSSRRGSVRITSGGWARKSIGASIARSPSFRPARALSTEMAC